LAKLDAPVWANAATALAGAASEAAQLAQMTEACDEGDEVACDNLSREEEAKRVWLSILDVPTWSAAAAAVSAVASEVNQSQAVSEEDAKQAWLSGELSEEEAKKAWLAKLDGPTWGKAASALSLTVAEAGQVAEMTAECDKGVTVACDDLSREDEAKREWLAKLELPAWGAAAAAVSAVALEVESLPTASTDPTVPAAVSAPDIAKQAWCPGAEAPAPVASSSKP